MIKWLARGLEYKSSPRSARVPAGERYYAIGDVHGRLDLFERLIADIRLDRESHPSKRAIVVLLGDIVDRGPDTSHLLTLCRAAAEHSADFIVLKGNHEEMMAQALRGDVAVLRVWLRCGGDATLASFGVQQEIIAAGASAELIEAALVHIAEDLIEWLEALPLHHSAGDYFFVHAGIRSGIPLAEQDPEDLLWIRGEFLSSSDDHGSIIVHGHTVVEDAEILKNRIAIDTGAYRTGRLTALVLEGTERSTITTEPLPSEPLLLDVALP
jgi:serine/threonine protein phosphatase 1